LKTPVAKVTRMQLYIGLVCPLVFGVSGCVKQPDKAEILASGISYYNERNYIQAEKKFEQSLKLFTEKGDTSPDVCSNEMYLANTRWELGKFKEAMDMHKAAMASMSKQYGADSEQVADAELRLGIDSYSMNDKKATKTHYENSLVILKKHLPKTQVKVKQLQSKIKALADNK
jgi:tetratricopeptide (TPR) repeat protein